MWAYLEQINAFTTSSILSKLTISRKQIQGLLLKTQTSTKICIVVSQSCLTLVLRFINFFISFECPENLSRGNLENQNYSLKMRLFRIQDSLILFPETSMPNKASNQRIYAPHSSMVKIGKSLKE